jgi:Uncharacterized protein conserved in bacteria (DUF2332)
VAAPSDDLIARTIARTAESYRTFSAEASGRSPQCEELALAVAGDNQLLAFLAGLPAAKRQPNLLFAGARLLLGEPGPGSRRSPGILVRDGTEPVAVTDSHGTWVEWLG